MASIFLKDPSAVLDYKFDWAPLTNGVAGAKSDWLASGETISTTPADVTVTADSGLTVDSYALTDSNRSVTAWLSGGTVGQDYTVVCHIKTSSVRTDERSITIRVRQR